MFIYQRKQMLADKLLFRANLPKYNICIYIANKL